jgi:hypothetical protein
MTEVCPNLELLFYGKVMYILNLTKKWCGQPFERHFLKTHLVRPDAIPNQLHFLNVF